jgi:hypothetical protein
MHHWRELWRRPLNRPTDRSRSTLGGLGVAESGRGRVRAKPYCVVMQEVPLAAPVFFVLKQPGFGESPPTGQLPMLPYRSDLLASAGVRVRWSDRHLEPGVSDSSPVSRVLSAAQRLGAPTALQMTLAWSEVTTSDAVVAMFENQGNAFAVARALRVPGARGPMFGVMSCWLAEMLPRLSAHRRAAYRWAYRSVDRLYYFSSNQTEIYQRYLDLPADRLRPVLFGVDVDGFRPTGTPVEDFVLVVGRDRGRDWATTFAALANAGLPAKVLCRPAEIGGHTVPGNVEVVGFVERDVYRDYLARARVVVVATRPLAYPTGQSVALEAMAMGKYVVATRTPAFEDYIVPGAIAAVPPFDPGGLARAIEVGFHDDDLRNAVGDAAVNTARERFSAAEMWSTIAGDLLGASQPYG